MSRRQGLNERKVSIEDIKEVATIIGKSNWPVVFAAAGAVVDDFCLPGVGFLRMADEAAAGFFDILFPSADSESDGITASSSPDGVESASSVLGSIAGFDITDG